jgi:hypothetical protein
MDWWMWLAMALLALFFVWAALRMRGRSGDFVDPRQDRETRMWRNSGTMP